MKSTPNRTGYILDVVQLGVNHSLVHFIPADLATEEELEAGPRNAIALEGPNQREAPYYTSQNVTITVYTIAGEKVTTLADGFFPGGKHRLTWDASDHASGVYFYRMEAGAFEETRNMLLLK